MKVSTVEQGGEKRLPVATVLPHCGAETGPGNLQMPVGCWGAHTVSDAGAITLPWLPCSVLLFLKQEQ